MRYAFKIIPGLALKDLRHEFIMSLCLIVAIASVIAPLLILLGLKNGTINTLRKRLVNDPAFRQIIPTETREYKKDWFKKLEKDENVGFLIPTILPASSTVYLVNPKTKTKTLIDILPTKKGDPLLEAAGISAPLAGQCVITSAVSKEYGISKGQEIEIKVSRYRGGKYEWGSQRLRVIGILPEQYGSLPRIYAPLRLLLDVEAFKEGHGVPQRGWKGSVARPYKRFDGILVFSESSLDPLVQNSLLIESGLAKIRSINQKRAESILGVKIINEPVIYDLGIPGGSVSIASLKAVKNRLRGFGTIILPYTKPFDLLINGRKIRVFGFSPGKRYEKFLKMPDLPWPDFSPKRGGKQILKIVLPRDEFPDNISQVEVDFKGANNVFFNLKVVGFTQDKISFIPLELSSILLTGKKRPISFDKKTGEFTLSQAGFRGFRLYAKSIDDVKPLFEKLQRQGISCTAKLQAIERIKTLDSGLTRLFWLVAVLGIIGAISVLAASLYGSVERKRAQLAVLRLLGLSRWDLFFFPIFEGLFLAIAASIMAIGGYFVISQIINRVFSDEMRAGESICSLPPGIIFWTVLLTLGVSALSSLIGAWKTSNIDPAEALRYE